jgi:hypothetical protein
MSNKLNNDEDIDEDMLPEYDFSRRVGVRGKYHRALRQGYMIKIDRTDGTTLVQHIVRPEGTVMLDPDVRAFFPDAESVNATLRALIRLLPTSEAKPKSS